jgi:DNA-directed RNA polymerase specialized sigma24 family protein
MDEKTANELVKLTKAVLLAQLQTLERPEKRERLEVVLARAGLTAREIAALLKKGEHAVSKAIQRGKAA